MGGVRRFRDPPMVSTEGGANGCRRRCDDVGRAPLANAMHHRIGDAMNRCAPQRAMRRERRQRSRSPGNQSILLTLAA